MNGRRLTMTKKVLRAKHVAARILSTMGGLEFRHAPGKQVRY